MLSKSDLKAIENIFEAKIDEKFEQFGNTIDEKFERFEERFDEKLIALEARMDTKLISLEERMDKKLSKELKELKFAVFDEIARTHRYLKNYMDETFVTKNSFERTLPTLLTQKEFHGTVDILMQEMQSLHFAFTAHEKTYH